MANRMPTQLRGPIPNGMNTYGLGLISLSGSHLISFSHQIKIRINYFHWRRFNDIISPVGIESVGIRVVLLVVVKWECWNSYDYALLDANAIVGHFLIASSLNPDKSRNV